MEQKVIVKNENTCIYFMKESNLGFYLLIPNSKHLKITLALFENTDENFVKSIKNNPDKAIVIPVIHADILKQANITGSQSYNYLNQVLTYLINTSYKILSYNRIEVDNQILLNNSKNLENFEQNFIAKYQGRVQSVKLMEEEIPQVITPITPQIETPLIKPDVDNIIPTEMPEEEKPIPKVESHEPGFVSYVLLGVVVAVLSLVFLYFIL